MALKAGRVGVALDQVDEFGKIKSEATSGYTKQEADAKFETQTAASTALALKQPISLQVPVKMLSGTKLTVETALQGLNDVADSVTKVVELASDADIVKLKEGFNFVKVLSGYEITMGDVKTISNNMRGYIVKNSNVINGIIALFDCSLVYFIGSDTSAGIKWCKTLYEIQ